MSENSHAEERLMDQLRQTMNSAPVPETLLPKNIETFLLSGRVERARVRTIRTRKMLAFAASFALVVVAAYAVLQTGGRLKNESSAPMLGGSADMAVTEDAAPGAAEEEAESGGVPTQDDYDGGGEMGTGMPEGAASGAAQQIIGAYTYVADEDGMTVFLADGDILSTLGYADGMPHMPYGMAEIAGYPVLALGEEDGFSVTLYACPGDELQALDVLRYDAAYVYMESLDDTLLLTMEHPADGSHSTVQLTVANGQFVR